MTSNISDLRAQNGSVTFLCMALGTMVIFPLVICLAHIIWLFGEHSMYQAALDGAALQAADTLSRVTINDPNFGYVSISNVPPIGTATRSSSGKALSVIGYNTLVGTVRLDNLISQQISNQTFINLARTDADNLKTTTLSLNTELSKAVSPTPLCSLSDWNGTKLEVYRGAKDNFLTSIGSEGSQVSKLLQFDVELGRAQNVVGTQIPIPARNLSNVPSATDAYYLPFKDYAVIDKHFSFAAVSNNASLISSADYLPADASQLSSIVKVSATVVLIDPVLVATPLRHLLGDSATINLVSCAKPPCMPETTPPGVLTIQFANGQIASISHLGDLLLSHDLNDKQAQFYTAANGNFPDDYASQLVENAPGDGNPSDASSIFATALYDWLRNQHCRANLSTVEKVLNYNFNNQSSKLVCIFEISPEGELLVRTAEQNPFSANLVSECQFMGQCTGTDSAPCQVMIRDEVHRLGPIKGGKDGGQPIPGDPVNWCELPDFGENLETAKTAGKGSKFLNITAVGRPSSLCRSAGALSPVGVVFQNLQRKDLKAQPHPNFYSGGLAVDVSFAFTGG